MRHIFIGILVFATQGSLAQELTAGDLAELREALRLQQATIERLQESQASQAQEISKLKRQLEGDTVATTVVRRTQDRGSASAADEGAVARVTFQGDRGEPGLGAATDASSLLKQPIQTAGKAISIGAHVNRAVNVVDDGNSTEAYFVDSANYPTLVYLKGYKQTDSGWTVGGHVEYAIQNNAATSVSQDNQEAGLETSSRFFELTFAHESYGTFWFGRGFMSSFLAVEADKSETWRYNLLSPGNSFGGMKFVDDRDDSLTDIQVNLAFLDVEAFSFRDRVRYDSPAWGGFQVSASAGSGDSGDVTLRFNGNLGDVELFAGGSVQTNPEAGRIDDRADLGVGLFHAPTGLNLSFGGVKQEFTREFYQQFGRTDGDNTGWIVRGGIRRNWFGPGETRIALDYSTGDDVLYEPDETESYGLFVGQMFDKLDLELYAGYRFYSYDTGPSSGGLDLKDINAFTFGTRIGFDATVSE